VTDDQHAPSGFTPLCDQRPEPLVGVEVEPCVGLVEKQQVGIGQQRQTGVELREGPAGQLVGASMGVAGENPSAS
jgi:hypothetical protein